MRTVIVYTSPTCPHCKTAKAYLDNQHISYIEKDVSTDHEARRTLVQEKIMGVPAFEINGRFLVGFNPDAIQDALNHHTTPCPQCKQTLRYPMGKGRLKLTCPKCHMQFMVEDHPE